MHSSTILDGLLVSGPRLPGGSQVGHYSVEDSNVVWTRAVCLNPHLFRLRNAWTVNGPLLEQLERHGVTLVRYVETTTRVLYEVDLDFFAAHAECFEGYARGEDVFALPRPLWQQTQPGEATELPLFAECSST